MRKLNLAVGALVAVTAPFAAAAAYEASVPARSVLTAAAVSTVPDSPAVTVRMRPCGARAQLHRGVCVRHRVHTVVVPVALAPVVQAPPQPAPGAPSHGWHPGHHGDHGPAPAAPTEPADEPASAEEDDQVCEDHGAQDDRSAHDAALQGEQDTCDDEDESGEHEDDDGDANLVGDAGQ